VEVKKDELLSLSCDSTGYPLPLIRFVKDNTILSQESTTFLLKHATPNISGALHCIAENKVGTAEKIFYINVVHVPQITSHFGNVTLMSDQTETLVCEAIGIPQPTIRWMHENGDLLSQSEILKLNSSDRQGTVVCEAINSQGKDAKYVRVKIINQPVMLPIASDLQTAQSIRENDDMELLCPFENYNTIAWTFNNQTLDGIEHKAIDKKLIIHNVNRLSGGEWSCLVSNAAGNASYVYNISILASPVIFASWNLNDRVSDFLFTESDIDEKVFKVGEKLILNCTADGSPKPKIQWRKSADVIGEGETLTVENLQFYHRLA
jgi:hemicentin